MERVTGIEPALSAWEAEVLPLNYTRVASTGKASDPASITVRQGRAQTRAAGPPIAGRAPELPLPRIRFGSTGSKDVKWGESLER